MKNGLFILTRKLVIILLVFSFFIESISGLQYIVFYAASLKEDIDLKEEKIEYGSNILYELDEYNGDYIKSFRNNKGEIEYYIYEEVVNNKDCIIELINDKYVINGLDYNSIIPLKINESFVYSYNESSFMIKYNNTFDAFGKKE